MQRIENEEAKDIAPKARLATGGQSVVVGAGLMCPGAILGGKTVTNGASGSSLSQLARFILLEQKNNHMRETTIIREETSLKASSYPNHSSTTTSAAATTNGPLEAPFGKLANVMQPTTRQIQMNSSSSKSKSSNNDNSNPAHKEAGRQAETLIDTIMRHNEMNSGDARVRVVVATEVVAATCCKAAATSSCWPYQSSRKSATPCTALTLALVSSYCLLAVCAILGQCAPTGTHIVASTPQETRKPAYSQQQHSEQVGVVFAGQPPNHIHHNHHHHQQQRRLVLPDASGLVDVNPAANQQPIHLSHQHNLMAYAATSKQKRLQQPQQIDSVNSDGGDGGDEDASSINVQPIIVLNDHSSKPSTATTTTTSSSSTTTAHHKLSEQLKQQQQQRDEANISMPQSAAASASSSPSHHRMLNQEQLAEQAAADDEEQLLLMLASDLASPTSFRRLIKRSGISDQRLAEIQMIRALKKQLERAANKIAAESNGGGDDGNSTKSQENTTA